MKKKIEKMQEISQADENCILLTGKDLKHITKAELVSKIESYRDMNSEAAYNAVKSLEELTELKKEIENLVKNQRRENFTEVPTEELNDVIEDVSTISAKLRKVVLDRVDGFEKRDLLMDCFQAVERVHSFCIGRSNANSETVKEY